MNYPTAGLLAGLTIWPSAQKAPAMQNRPNRWTISARLVTEFDGAQDLADGVAHIMKHRSLSTQNAIHPARNIRYWHIGDTGVHFPPYELTDPQ